MRELTQIVQEIDNSDKQYIRLIGDEESPLNFSTLSVDAELFNLIRNYYVKSLEEEKQEFEEM